MEQLKGKAKKGLNEFLNVIENLSEKLTTPGVLLSDVCKECVLGTGYLEMLNDAGDHERIENLEKLIDTIKSFEEEHSGATIQDFFDEIALYATDNESAAPRNVVNLMSLHASKGLEFEVVFIVGMSEYVFPHHLAIQNGQIEEERRLCYVGFTRAKEILILTCPKSRHFSFSKMIPKSNLDISRFIQEVPSEYIDYHEYT
jgi:DNA helicase-2/ATP-dependent DNA helicase PcrA